MAIKIATWLVQMESGGLIQNLHLINYLIIYEYIFRYSIVRVPFSSEISSVTSFES